MACKIMAVNQRSSVKDFVDIAEMVNNGVSMEQGFAGALALAKASRLGESQLNLSALKEDFKSKSLVNFLDYKNIVFKKEVPNYAEILKKNATDLNLDAVYKKRISVKKECICKMLGR